MAYINGLKTFFGGIPRTGGAKWAGLYSASMLYSKGSIVAYQGSVYLKVSIAAAGTVPTDTSAWKFLGKAVSGSETLRVNGKHNIAGAEYVDVQTATENSWEGDYESGKNYTKGQIVVYQGIVYIVIKDTDSDPTDDTAFAPVTELAKDSPLPIEVSTEAEMTALLTSGEIGGVYKYTGTAGTYEHGALYVLEYGPYLTFSSPSSFTLNVVDNTKHWDGTLEYSTDTSTWNTWDGTTTLSADSGKLYLRGTGNTCITGLDASTSKARWVLEGSEISCIGNIENLLDYETVARGRHPAMAECCYFFMFSGCTNLIAAPKLPATTLAKECYRYMFFGCTNLIAAPELPATTLAESCYYDMFCGCTNLIAAPKLPATTLAGGCYYEMFSGCANLITAPELPATTLAGGCYNYMFSGCTNLIAAPKLPATTLATGCYGGMFSGCTNIKLSARQMDDYQTEYRIPTSGEGTMAREALDNMFKYTGGTFTGTPEINTTYYLHTSNSIV